jgi:hypothetical protein
MARRAAPTPKVAATGVGGAAAVLVVWVAGKLGFTIGPEPAAAIALLLSAAAGYLKRDRSSPSPAPADR